MDEDNYADVKIFLVLDSNGDYSVGKDADTAAEFHNDDCTSGIATEVVVLNLRKRIPAAISAEVNATLPQSEDGSYRLEVQQS